MNKIEFRNASLWYDEVIALNEVTFEFKSGITGLVGSNGAGKTSSIKLAASLLKPTLGEVLINGEDVWQNYEYMKNMGYSPELDRQFNWLTGRKFLSWNARMFGIPYEKAKQKVDEILKVVGMTHAADREIEGYSRGMRQRIKVGQALINDPEILLVDEPMSGTDPIGRNILAKVFNELAHEKEVTLVVSSHVLHELERISDRIIVLESGKLIAEGPVADVRSALSRVPHKVKITSNNSKELAQNIIEHVKGMKYLNNQEIVVEVSNRELFSKKLIDIADKHDIKIFEMTPQDENLMSVFKLLKHRSSQGIL